ncbi:MAG TPA: OmpA family protein [Chitinophagaceae bacterium]|nr:OmpA family protein [Chitinophagaceae bacterium]
MKTVLTIFCLLLCVRHGLSQPGYDTVKVYFPINIIVPDRAATESMDHAIRLIGQKNCLIYGYADYLGNEPSNLDLAIGRANNVRKYLQEGGILPNQILICEGIGQVNRNVIQSREGYPEDRRVDIFIKKGGTENKGHTITFKAAPDTGKKKMQVSEITTRGRLIPVKTVPKKDPPPDTVKPIVAAEKNIAKRAIPSRPITQRPPSTISFDNLSKLKANDVLRVENIHFLPTKHIITEDSEPILRALLQTMLDFPQLAIRIEGHVCCIRGAGDALDTDTYELKLSENRARHIYLYLITNGIDGTRIEYAGFGKSRPIVAEEKTEEDAQRNRRVEIRVLRN